MIILVKLYQFKNYYKSGSKLHDVANNVIDVIISHCALLLNIKMMCEGH